jgi:hypothetical protein
MSTREPAFIVDNDAAGPCLRIADADCEDNVLFVEIANAPRLLRDLAEATATACGWPVQEAEGVRIGASRRPIVTFMLGDVEHAADPQSARVLAVALLRAAAEAEATK